MRHFIYEMVFGKNTKLSGLIALAVIASIALGCDSSKNLVNLAQESNGTTSDTDLAVPSDSVVEGLVKDTTSRFADAIDSGDFSDLYSNASTEFQKTYTVSDLKSAFKAYTDKKSVVLPVLKKVESADAEFSQPPSIRTESTKGETGIKILMAGGKFPTNPYNVRFGYEYVLRDGEWKLLKMVINIP